MVATEFGNLLVSDTQTTFWDVQMKNFKCQLNIFSRSSGASVIQRSAYRCGQKLIDYETGVTHNYAHRNDVSYSAMFAPKNSPAWAMYPEQAWNQVNKVESRKNSRLARELMISLPAAFNFEERVRVLDEIALFLVDEYKVLVQVDQHDPKIFSASEILKMKFQHAVPMPDAPDFFHNQNFHAHILFSTRELTPFGFGPKTRKLDDKKTGHHEVEKIRETVASIINAKARALGIDLFMHAKSARRRGATTIPTMPLGQKGHWAAKRGLPNATAELNERIKAYNEKPALTEADFDEFLKQPGFSKPSPGLTM